MTFMPEYEYHRIVPTEAAVPKFETLLCLGRIDDSKVFFQAWPELSEDGVVRSVSYRLHTPGMSPGPSINHLDAGALIKLSGLVFHFERWLAGSADWPIA